MITRRSLSTFGIFAVLTALGCAHGSKTTGPEGQTVFTPVSTSYKLRPYSEYTMKNGMRVLLIEDKALPYTTYAMLIKAGGYQDSPQQAGLANMVAELLDRGTKNMTATQFADEIGEMGADLDISAQSDYTLIQASATSAYQERLLGALSAMVTGPTFAEAEIRRARQQLIASRMKLPDSASMFSDRAFDQLVFDTHPYGRAVSGTVASMSRIRRKDIIKFYLQHYRPNNALFAVVGRYPANIKEKLEAAFAGWEARETQPRQPQKMPENKPAIRLVTNPSLTQTQIRIGAKGIRRSDPDFFALRIGNAVLGGGGEFNNRLNMRVRNQLGLTYSIQSQFDARVDEGPFEISTFTRNAKTGEAIREALGVLKDFVKNGATEQEVAGAKAYMIGTFPLAIETAEKLAFNLLYLRLHGVPDTYLSRYIANVNHIGAKEVNQAIKRHLDPDTMKILVYSEHKTATELKKLGPVEVVNFTAVP